MRRGSWQKTGESQWSCWKALASPLLIKTLHFYLIPHPGGMAAADEIQNYYILCAPLLLYDRHSAELRLLSSSCSRVRVSPLPSHLSWLLFMGPMVVLVLTSSSWIALTQWSSFHSLVLGQWPGPFPHQSSSLFFLNEKGSFLIAAIRCDNMYVCLDIYKGPCES